MNFDYWFDYTRLEEAEGDPSRIREIYERAIQNIPVIQEKKYWRRYIFLWINYALYEELTANNLNRAEEIYKKCFEIIPHNNFTFSKLWILFAHLLLRQDSLSQARKLLGYGIGVCPREKLFKAYIELELQMGNVDRCRTIYEKFIESQPENANAWVKYAEFELMMQENERCNAILELAITLNIDMPEIVWKAYINIEIESGNIDKVRELYLRLLKKTKHTKVWLSYAKFEQLEAQKSIESNSDEEITEEMINTALENTRKVFSDAYEYYKGLCLSDFGEAIDIEKEDEKLKFKEERIVILEHWINFEREHDKQRESLLIERYPKKVPKRRKIRKFNEESENTTNIEEVASKMTSDEDNSAGYEEYYDYVFPEDEKGPGLKILENAKKWAEALKSQTA